MRIRRKIYFQGEENLSARVLVLLAKTNLGHIRFGNRQVLKGATPLFMRKDNHAFF